MLRVIADGQNESHDKKWCEGAELNRRHTDFQGRIKKMSNVLVFL
jgi:hypothetical protein